MDEIEEGDENAGEDEDEAQGTLRFGTKEEINEYQDSEDDDDQEAEDDSSGSSDDDDKDCFAAERLSVHVSCRK